MDKTYALYVFDCETTGLDNEIHDIIEISFLRLSDGEQKTWCLKPLNPLQITEKALKINGHKLEDILHQTPYGRETYKEAADVVAEMEAWVISDGFPIEDRILIGQNVKFDYDFSKMLWGKVGSPDSFPFKEMLIDTMQLVRLIDICVGKKRPGYSLKAFVRDFGITKSKAHRADGDVKMTAELFSVIFDSIKEFMTSTFGEKYSE